MTIPVQRTTVDGVPVVWVDTPGRLHAQLVFGVGIADEEFLTSGVTHLVEHLVMRQLDEGPHAANAGVGTSFTTFEVLSSPAVVVDHLRRLCSAIADPDVAHIALERGVIGAEEDKYGAGPLDVFPAALRFGNRGPGLIGNVQLAAHLLDADAVRDWCHRWLHRGNAVLVLDGPPPDGLSLPLPDGPRPARVLPPVHELPTPAYVATPFEGVLIGMHRPWSAELGTALGVLDNRLTRRLRREAGLIYEVGVERTQLLDDTTLVGIGVDAPDDQVPTVLTHLFDVLDELCSDGPTAEELQRDRDTLLEDRADVAEQARGRVFEAAVEHLSGVQPSEVQQQQVLDGLEPAAVVRALRAARDSMVLSVPLDAAPPALPRLPDSPVLTGQLHARARFGSGADRGGRLVVADAGLTLYYGRGPEAVTVCYADVVGVGIEPGPKGDELFVLHAGEGDSLVLRARDWRDGQAAVGAMRAAVPAGLFFPTPERMRVIQPD